MSGHVNHVGIVVQDLDEIEQRVRSNRFETQKHADYEPGRSFISMMTRGYRLKSSHITADCIWRRVYHMSEYQLQTGERRDIYPCHMEHQFGSITEKLGYGFDATRGSRCFVPTGM